VSIEGLWTAEMFGLHGWENSGVIMLRDGQALGGGRHHYSIGTYSYSGEDFSMALAITYHGPPRTLFGSSDKKLSINVDGQVEGGEILGSVSRTGSPKQTLAFRLTKRTDTP
jgi:hypothetical protein